MKIRILGNTIRLRLKVYEVEALRDQGLIEEVLAFGPSESNQLRFRIRTGEDAFAIDQQGTSITITVPRTVAQAWTTTDLVGFDQTISTSMEREVYVLIEKDFACLDGEREDEPGSYPNPIEGCNT